MTIRGILRKNIISFVLLFLTFLTFIISVVSNKSVSSTISSNTVERIEKSLSKKQIELEDIILNAFHQHENELPPFDNIWTSEVSKKGFSLLVIDSDELLYWSENLYMDLNQLKNINNTEFMHIGNSWYVVTPYTFGKYKAIGLILVYTEYLHENKYLKNGANPNLKFPENAFVIEMNSVLGSTIQGVDGDNLFKISINTSLKKKNTLTELFIWLSLLFAISFITISFYNCKIEYTFLALLILFIIRVFVYMHISNTYSNYLFSPMVYADSAILPSLGDLAISVMFLLSFFIVLSSSVNNRYEGCKHRKGVYLIYSVVLGIFGLIVHYIVSSLIINSNISFSFGTLEYPNVIFYLISSITVAILFALFYQMVYLQFKFFKTVTTKCRFVQAAVVTILFTIAAFYDIYYLLGIISAIIILIAHRFKKLNFTILIVISTIFSIYLSVSVLLYSDRKMHSERDSIAQSLFTDRDPITEFLLKEVEESIVSNEKIQADLFKNEFLQDKLIRYIKEKYFQGYFIRYNVSIDICSNRSMIFISEERKASVCETYYTNEILEIGEPISPNSSFYHITDDNTSSYLGGLNYVDTLHKSVYLFIKLDAKEDVDIIGYPDLLVANDNNIDLSRGVFFSAKYIDNKLVSAPDFFDFEYELNKNNLHKKDGHNLYLYNMNDRVSFVVAGHRLSFVEIASIFSHSFIFVFLTFLIIFVRVTEFDINFRRLSYRWKVYLVVIGSFTIMLTLMAAFILVYSINKAEERNKYNIHERIKAVLISFDKIGLDVLWGDAKRAKVFDEQIISLSNAFHTDINVYNLKGELMSTSRPEMIEKHLIGTYINRKAFSALVNNKLSKFINVEQIGELSYLSVYAKYNNNFGEHIGYVNLPYFVRESEMSQEMTSLLETILNIYILLAVIGLIISTFIVNKITRPLNDVRQKMERLDLLGQPEPIIYRQDDELGDLIKEYNRMILELAESAKKLATSEREAAWGEMARQIAHEIKNPLTPMKLGLQHVMRMKKDNREGWEDKVDEISKSILEQIEVLSETASEFSSFAKLNKQKLSTIELGECLDSCIKLFSNYSNVDIIISGREKEHYVSANQEQLIRVFTNLIKNGIEAPNKNKIKKINITIREFNSEFYISVKDNGVGIKTEQAKNLFRPNFTTKSSGTGLGLAISRSIMESFNGTINYIPEKGGACFEIRIAKI